ncbi:HPr kinase/phosphorylase [Pseudooceanicola sp. HF7]|uniref:HPr kinase/phosphorylase n=1 Tax=Pseudooceanicola sp. HF7 TaxID=2721560 RepID=UPI0034C68759
MSARQGLHASCVALDPDRAVLILGASGSGKSSLALELMARGAQLVADDRVDLRQEGAALWASAPQTIVGKIEARGVGILNARALAGARVTLCVDLDQRESERLPPQRSSFLLGVSLPLLHNTGTAAFPAAILQYLREGRFA